jgi:hypothetical protein
VRGEGSAHIYHLEVLYDDSERCSALGFRRRFNMGFGKSWSRFCMRFKIGGLSRRFNMSFRRRFCFEFQKKVLHELSGGSA